MLKESYMYNFIVLNLSNSDKWREYLQQLPVEKQDIYFTPEYYQLYELLGDGLAQCFVFQKGNDLAMYPFLKNDINSLGYELDRKYFDIQGAYGYNGVIASSYDHDFIESFYRVFDSYCEKENIIAEFTRFHPILKNEIFSNNNLDVVFDRRIIYIELAKPYEIIFKEFQTTTKKQIKRAINRHNIQVLHFENDISVLDDFWSIYTESMNRIGAIPYLHFTKDYFKSLLKTKGCHCFFASYNNQPIAAITAFYNKTYIHGHLGGSLTEFMNLSAFSLLYAEMIRFGQKRSCRFLHIGGGTTNNADDPLLKYKMNFSDTSSEFYIGKKIHNPNIYEKVVGQWKRSYPEKEEEFKNHLLKYRF